MQNKTCIETRSDDAQPSRPGTGADQRQASRGANQNVALALVGVAAVSRRSALARWFSMDLSEVSRRGVLRLSAGGAAGLALSGCRDDGWYGVNVTGTLPDLELTMTRARDGAMVTEDDFRGRAVVLFFGFTFCPDVCPLTLANLTAVADALGPRADELAIVFVTVDPDRDTLDELAAYVAAFTERATGLRGDPNQLAALARRLRVTYKVAPHDEGETDYAVSHGKSVYIFGPDGEARLMWPEFDTAEANISAAAGDLERLIGGA